MGHSFHRCRTLISTSRHYTYALMVRMLLTDNLEGGLSPTRKILEDRYRYNVSHTRLWLRGIKSDAIGYLTIAYAALTYRP